MSVVASMVGFGLKHWTWLAMAALVLMLSVTSERLKHAKADQWDAHPCAACKPAKWKDEVGSLRPALARVTADLAQCKSNTDRLSGALDTQTRAVKDAQAAGDARQALAQKATTDARAITESLRRQSAAIAAAKPPASCEAADALILGSLRP